MASIAACHWNDEGGDIANEAVAVADEAAEGFDEPVKLVNGGLGIFLALCATGVLIAGNYKKVKMISIYIKP